METWHAAPRTLPAAPPQPPPPPPTLPGWSLLAGRCAPGCEAALPALSSLNAPPDTRRSTRAGHVRASTSRGGRPVLQRLRTSSLFLPTSFCGGGITALTRCARGSRSTWEGLHPAGEAYYFLLQMLKHCWQTGARCMPSNQAGPSTWRRLWSGTAAPPDGCLPLRALPPLHITRNIHGSQA